MNKKNEYEGSMIENLIFARNLFWGMVAVILIPMAIIGLAVLFGKAFGGPKW